MPLATDIIKASEGLRLKAYRDSTSVWTIGWGHTKGVVYAMTITEEQAEGFLLEDMAWVISTIRRTVTAPLNENQHAALASLIFNIGETQWRTSTALRRLNAGNYAGVAEAMVWFNKSRDANNVLEFNQGLANRRERERTLFMATPLPATAPAPVARGGIYGGKAKPLIRSKTQWFAGLGLTGVLANMLAAFSSIKMVVPEVILTVGPLVLLGGIFIAIMVNRLIDSRKGVH